MAIIVPLASTTRTFKQLQDEVLHDEFDDAKYRTLVKRWLNEAADKVNEKMRLPGSEGHSQLIDLTAGEDEYALGVEVLKIDSLRYGARNLIEADINELDEFPAESRGMPTHFSLYGSTITVWPTPDSTYELDARYTTAITPMVNDSDPPAVPGQYADVLINYAKAKAFAAEDDPEMSAFFMGQHKEELREMRIALQERTRNRPRQIQGMMVARTNPRFERP
jgi:hypothetical protein